MPRDDQPIDDSERDDDDVDADNDDDGDDEYNPDNDRPMTEAEWEKEMKASDLRADRFGEIMETVMDEPDADEIVAREMGYDDFADELKEYKRAKEAGEIEEEEDEPFEIDEAIQEEMDESDASLEQIPAYILATQAADAVRIALEPLNKARGGADEDDQSEEDEAISELIGKAFIGIHITCAKLSGGHAMGYDEQSLGGNVVNNRRGLQGTRDSIIAFEEMRERKMLPVETIDVLLTQLREVEVAMVERIAELRSKMWWDTDEKSQP